VRRRAPDSRASHNPFWGRSISIPGFEPTYAPGQSYAPRLGSLLLCLVPASAPEAVPTMMARAIAVRGNIVAHWGTFAG
jgi:hypothetical protein